jgi:hypothetical protein
MYARPRLLGELETAPVPRGAEPGAVPRVASTANQLVPSVPVRKSAAAATVPKHPKLSAKVPVAVVRRCLCHLPPNRAWSPSIETERRSADEACCDLPWIRRAECGSAALAGEVRNASRGQ